MMKIIKGDLIKLAEQGEFTMIVHGANCFHTMGGGIAGQLAIKYPQVLEADKKTTYADREKLGKCSIVSVDSGKNTFLVVNAYTQYQCSSGSDVFEYKHFEEFLERLVPTTLYGTQGTRRRGSIGFPMIGAGLAGGDWSRISKMIKKFSENVAPYADVTVVEYQP